MSINPYEPPKVECSPWRAVDYAGVFFSAGLMGLIAGYGVNNIVSSVLAMLPDRVVTFANETYQYGPPAAGFLFGITCALVWYSIAIRKARDAANQSE